MVLDGSAEIALRCDTFGMQVEDACVGTGQASITLDFRFSEYIFTQDTCRQKLYVFEFILIDLVSLLFCYYDSKNFLQGKLDPRWDMIDVIDCG